MYFFQTTFTTIMNSLQYPLWVTDKSSPKLDNKRKYKMLDWGHRDTKINGLLHNISCLIQRMRYYVNTACIRFSSGRDLFNERVDEQINSRALWIQSWEGNLTLSMRGSIVCLPPS